MIEKLKEKVQAFEELQKELQNPSIIQDQKKYVALRKRIAELEPFVQAQDRYQKILKELKDTEYLLSQSDLDEEMKALAKEEYQSLLSQKEQWEQKIRKLLLPKDPQDDRNVILEIRAGTGGEEAALFAADLLRMYSRFAENMGWKMSITEGHYSDLGGVKEVVAVVEGKHAYGYLKYESGVHRVQRVPRTETSGRIHTSAATVAVLPEAEDVEVELDEKDLKIDRFCASGPGGQHVNRTMSAIRITHLPTGIVVSCQDEKSQHQNLAKAKRILRSRLLDLESQKQQDAMSEARKLQIGTGDRSEKIRTYNFPQGRITDHRIGLTLYRLEEILDGALTPLIEALEEREMEKRLAAS